MVFFLVPGQPPGSSPFPSSALSRTLAALPAVVGDGKPDTTSVLAAAGLTVMPDWLPVMAPLAVSVAVSDWLAAGVGGALNGSTAAAPPPKPSSAGRDDLPLEMLNRA